MSAFGDDFNPYAAPVADITAKPAPATGFWRAGNDLIMSRKDSELPDRCMKCNAPAEGYRLKKTLSWHPQGYYILLLVSPILYIIVALIVRKTAKVRFPLCPEHRQRRRRAILIGWLLGLGGIPVAIGIIAASSTLRGPQSDTGAVVGVVVGIVMTIAGMVVGFSGARVASTTKIDKQFVYLSNVGPEFLASLPPYAG